MYSLLLVLIVAIVVLTLLLISSYIAYDIEKAHGQELYGKLREAIKQRDKANDKLQQISKLAE